MNARAPEHLDGDTIADRIQHHQSNNFSDIARDLTDAHAHRPTAFQADLDKANDAFHAQGLLPHMDLVGVQGSNLIVHDERGRTLSVDSAHLSHHHVLKDEGTTEINGRTATINADGSGAIKVNAGDSAWSVAHDVLASQGTSNPSDNQVANYILELKRANGDLSTIHPGDSIKLPPTVRGGDNADQSQNREESQSLGRSGSDRDRASADESQSLRGDRQSTGDGVDPQSKQDVTGLFNAASHAEHHLGDNGLWDSGLSREDIDHALDGNVSAEDRRGLEFMRDNFDTLRHNSWDGIVGVDQNKIYASDLRDWRDHALATLPDTTTTD